MKRNLPLSLLFIVSACPLAAETRSLCRSDEQTVFACTLTNKKHVALCASKPLTPTTGYVQYRYGTLRSIELEYPTKREPPHGKFFFSTVMYSGGGASTVRFQSGPYEYFVFDKVVRTNFTPGEPNDPAFDAGVATRQMGKSPTVRHCVDDAANSDLAYTRFDREEYDETVIP